MPRADYLSAVSEELKQTQAIFSQNLKEARKARGWTQIEAAERCLLSWGPIGRRSKAVLVRR